MTPHYKIEQEAMKRAADYASDRLDEIREIVEWAIVHDNTYNSFGVYMSAGCNLLKGTVDFIDTQNYHDQFPQSGYKKDLSIDYMRTLRRQRISGEPDLIALTEARIDLVKERGAPSLTNRYVKFCNNQLDKRIMYLVNFKTAQGNKQKMEARCAQ